MEPGPQRPPSGRPKSHGPLLLQCPGGASVHSRASREVKLREKPGDVPLRHNTPFEHVARTHSTNRGQYIKSHLSRALRRGRQDPQSSERISPSSRTLSRSNCRISAVAGCSTVISAASAAALVCTQHQMQLSAKSNVIYPKVTAKAHHTSIMVSPIEQVSPKRLYFQCPPRADHVAAVLAAGQRNVQPPRVCKEPDVDLRSRCRLAALGDTDGREYHDVLLSTLECVDGVEFDFARQPGRLEPPPQLRELVDIPATYSSSLRPG